MSTNSVLTKIWRIFAGLVVSALLNSAWAGPSCHALFSAQAQLTESQIRLQEQWDILDSMRAKKDKKLKRQAARVVNEIMAVWSEQGIAYETDPENQYNLLVKIPETKQEYLRAHSMNRMAFSMKRHFAIKISGQKVGKEFRVSVNPLELKREEAGALFDEQTSTLTLARDNVVQGQTDDMVGHETRHAFNFYELAAGNDHDFAAWISNSETQPIFQETYPHLFSADELPAYVKQLSVILHSVVRKKESLEDARNFVEVALKLADAASRPQVLDLSRQLVSDMRLHPGNWSAPLKAKENIDGEEVDVVRISSSRFKSRVYFYEAPLIEAQAGEVPIKVTHAVFQNGDDKLDLMTLEPLDANNLAPLLAKVEGKISRLQIRVDGIQKNLRQAQEALGKDNGPDALLAIHRAMPSISIKRKKQP